MSAEFDALARALAGARRVAALTGAGVSAESGVPTFRGPDGLWRGHRPESLATPEAFARDPETVWQFYDWRRTRLAGCRPNPAHSVLAALESRLETLTLATQNVDGLHQSAGSSGVLELHGNIWRVRCTAGCGEWLDERAPLPPPLPPLCRCGAALRPCVVWFGEALPEETFAAAYRAAASADLFLVAGTSGVVYPAASLAEVAHGAGATVVEINPDQTPLSSIAEITIRSAAGTALAAVAQRLELPA